MEEPVLAVYATGCSQSMPGLFTGSSGHKGQWPEFERIFFLWKKGVGFHGISDLSRQSLSNRNYRRKVLSFGGVFWQISGNCIKL
ncbi:hypothetical protein CKAN_02475600 [Cinnamomum micranthum f. kanehirae]|uniref:Uncharacterized protein n=1 Tax=Cinnamomum micranthum f. kanehirae TaxID=337451 RepID=A0A3S3P7V2_9MAGN|nr:hypothetical protein CKAN_02475600 [Cinnamomum micranthum f. kanehirae]